MSDPLPSLARPDKHYLGAGDEILFAPRFPRWLHRPGFWDEIHVAHYPLSPLFTVTFLVTRDGEPGQPLPLEQRRRRWTPAELVADYRLGRGFRGREHRSLLHGGHCLSEWKLDNKIDSPQTLIAVAWTVQDTSALDLSAVGVSPGSVRFQRVLEDRHGQRLPVEIVLEVSGAGMFGGAYLSEGTALEPRWELTPFPEKWRHGVAAEECLGGISSRGVLYLAAASAVTLPAGGSRTVRLGARVRPSEWLVPRMTAPLADRLREHAPPPPPPSLTGPAGPPAEVRPGEASRADWSAFFDSCPRLVCSDAYIERYWYYRWYGLRLCGIPGGVGNHVYPGCCEGTGYFHVPIAYSAGCHARELRWLSDPARARGVILNFLAHQLASGKLLGRIYCNHLVGTDFYFGNWGDAVSAVDAVHPGLEFLRAVYEPLALYAEWLERERDREASGLTDVIDHFETGQEYMSRYMAVSAEADSESWGERIRLKGVDATVYTYQLQRALAAIAVRLHDFGDAARWIGAAERTGAAVARYMWDAEVEMFSDVDPASMRRTGAKAAVCFYPYFTDLVGAEHVSGLRRHLLDPGEFWTMYPVPSTSADDPYYSPDAEWKGKRHNCPWNGRVWPMTNSHVAEALARTAVNHDPTLRPLVAEFIHRFVRMLFHDGDPQRPNCHEHYNPETGRPSLYRGFDDYQHSWVNDLIVRYVAGFRPGDGEEFTVDPFPFGLEALTLERLPFRGRQIGIELAGEQFSVRVDGEDRGTSRLGASIDVSLA